MNAALEVIIGLTYIYLLTSLAATAAMEFIAAFFHLRAKNLEKALAGYLASSEAGGIQVEDFFKHPLLSPLKLEDRSPSYIPASTVVSALLSSLNLTKKLASATEELWAEVSDSPLKNEIEKSPLKQRLQMIWEESEQKADVFRTRLEQHYDQVMERAGGWYKRDVQGILLIIGLYISLFLNIDTLEIAKTLWVTPTLRTAIADQATDYVKKQSEDKTTPSTPTGQDTATTAKEPSPTPTPTFQDKTIEITKAIDNLVRETFPIGCKKEEKEADLSLSIFNKILGILVSALAVSLGAPFWFDALGKFVNLRASGKAPTAPSKDESSSG